MWVTRNRITCCTSSFHQWDEKNNLSSTKKKEKANPSPWYVQKCFFWVAGRCLIPLNLIANLMWRVLKGASATCGALTYGISLVDCGGWLRWDGLWGVQDGGALWSAATLTGKQVQIFMSFSFSLRFISPCTIGLADRQLLGVLIYRLDTADRLNISQWVWVAAHS